MLGRSSVWSSKAKTPTHGEVSKYVVTVLRRTLRLDHVICQVPCSSLSGLVSDFANTFIYYDRFVPIKRSGNT